MKTENGRSAHAAGAGFGLVLAAAVAAAQGLPPASPTPQVRPSAPPAEGRPSQSLSRRAPLSEILLAIEREHGVKIMDPMGVLDGAQIRPDVREQPPEAAIRALLGEFELLFYYPSGGREAPPRLHEVWVYPPGKLDRRALAGKPAQSAVELAVDDATRRAAIIDDAVRRDPAAAVELVLEGLRDADGTVRERTLVSAISMGVPVPTETLMELLRSDPAEGVRSAAMDALVMTLGTETGALREILDQARADPSPAVQAKATDLSTIMEAQPEAPPAGEEVLETPEEIPPESLPAPADESFPMPIR